MEFKYCEKQVNDAVLIKTRCLNSFRVLFNGEIISYRNFRKAKVQKLLKKHNGKLLNKRKIVSNDSLSILIKDGHIR